MNAVDWSCATQVKRPRDMEQQLIEFRALLRHVRHESMFPSFLLEMKCGGTVFFLFLCLVVGLGCVDRRDRPECYV